MNDEQLTQWLRRADIDPSPEPFDAAGLAAAVRRRYARRKKGRRITAACCTAVIVLITAAGGGFYQAHHKQQQIVRLQQQIDQLTQQTEATVKLVDDLLARQQQADKLAAMNRRLASCTDPAQSIRTQVNEAAAVLLFRADRRQKQADPAGAAQTWQQIIDCFPQTTAAQTARRHLQTIQQPQPDQI